MENRTADVIYYANEIGPLTHRDLCELTKMHPVSLWRLLPKLVKAKKLYCVEQGMHKPNIYATYNIKRRTDLEHDISRARVATAIYKTGLVTYWWQPKVKLPTDKSVNEDASFKLTLELPDRFVTIPYFLEMDMGTEPYRQLEDKFRRYLARPEKGQVIFVVKHDPGKHHRTQPTTLAELAEKYLDKSKPFTWKKFLFADYDTFIKDALALVCYTAYDSKQYSILPPLIEQS